MRKNRICKITHCCICGEQVKYISRHLRLHHPDITEKDYYDKFLKKNNEGFCKTCGKIMPFRSIQNGYRQYCNQSCEMKDKDLQIELRKKYKEKTGYEHNFQNPKVIKQIKKTNKKLYGGIGFASEELINKALKTYNEENKTDYISFCQVSHNEESEKNRIKNRIKNNGGKYINDKTFKKMIKNAQKAKIKNKRIKTRLKNNPNYISDNYLKKLQEKSLITYAWAKMKLYKKHDKGNCVCHCEKCGNDYEINLCTLRTRKDSNKTLCTICNPLYSGCANNHTTSKEEKEFVAEIKKIYNGIIIENDRTILGDNKELDAYLPELNIGFEYNGDYWHANPLYYKSTDILAEGKNAQEIWNRDELKKQICESKGIKLISVFSTDWLYHKDKVIEQLKELLCK